MVAKTSPWHWQRTRNKEQLKPPAAAKLFVGVATFSIFIIMRSFWWGLGAVHSTSPGITHFMRITGKKKSVSVTAFWQLMITAGTAVKRFQTEEQVISQSYPEGSTFPIWTPMEKREFPLFKFLQSMCMRGKCNFFFSSKKKKFYSSVLYNL